MEKNCDNISLILGKKQWYIQNWYWTTIAIELWFTMKNTMVLYQKLHVWYYTEIYRTLIYCEKKPMVSHRNLWNFNYRHYRIIYSKPLLTIVLYYLLVISTKVGAVLRYETGHQSNLPSFSTKNKRLVSKEAPYDKNRCLPYGRKSRFA